MSLIQKYTSPSHYFNPKRVHPNPLPKPFDDALTRRLSALRSSLAESSPSVPLSFLLDFLSILNSTLLSASLLFSDPNFKPEPEPASSHLDASVSLLDSLNLLTARVDRLSRLRLHVTFAVRTCNALSSLSEWNLHLHESSFSISPSDLVKNGTPPRGKISAVLRAIYAVESVSALVFGSVLSFIAGADYKEDLEKIRIPEESSFPWSGEFNGLLTAVGERMVDGRFATEIEAVDETVKEMTAALNLNGEVKEMTAVLNLNGEVKGECERRTVELAEGLDRLGSTINGLFRTALSTRDAVLRGFRVGAHKCK